MYKVVQIQVKLLLMFVSNHIISMMEGLKLISQDEFMMKEGKGK